VRLCQLPEGRSEEGSQQQEIECDAGDEACCEDEVSEIQVDHGRWGKDQIRFANLRQDAEGSVALLFKCHCHRPA
jgi:hypothetical protein